MAIINQNLRGGTQFGLQRPADNGQFNPLFLNSSFDNLQAGDRFQTHSYDSPDMGRPNVGEGGQWIFAGNKHIGGPAVSGTDYGGNQAMYSTTWEWMPDPVAPQQQPAPAPQQQRQDVPAQLPIYDDWNAYRQMARAQTEGLNRMPFVFGDYQQIPTDPQSAFEMFYPGNMQGWQNQLRNPLFESTEVPFSSSGVSQNPNPTQGFGSPFINPMFR